MPNLKITEQPPGRRMVGIVRPMIGFKVEGDVLYFLRDNLPEGKFQRGGEGSTFDAGISIDRAENGDDDTTGEEILALDVKTYCTAKQEAQLGKSDRYWRGRVNGQPAQSTCDAYLISFPLQRNPGWLCIHPRTTHLDSNTVLAFTYSDPGHQIVSDIPPTMWPLMIPHQSVPDVIKCLSTYPLSTSYAMPVQHLSGAKAGRHKHSTTTVTPTSSNNTIGSPQYFLAANTTQDICSATGTKFTLLLDYLKQQFTHQTEYTLRETRYQPYTADFEVVNREGQAVFVEAKFGACTVLEMPKDAASTMIKIRHKATNHDGYKDGTLIFIATGARFTYLLSEVTVPGRRGGSFKYKGGSVSRYFILLHRDQVPKPWWNRPCSQDTYFDDYVPLTTLIRLDSNIVATFRDAFAQANQRFALPPLESLESLTLEQIKFNALAKDTIDDLKQEETSPEHDAQGSLATIESTHFLHYYHQSRASLLVHRLCYLRGRGVLYDHQANTRDLRAYAFTDWHWSPTDSEYTTLRPRRQPIQMFEFESQQRFLLLSFGLIRPAYDDPGCFYAHPFLLDTLHLDTRTNENTNRGRILILQVEPDHSGVSSLSPLFMVPASLLDVRKAITNHSHWRLVKLTNMKSLNQYAKSGWSAVFSTLLSTLRNHDPQNESGTLSCDMEDHTITIPTRDDIFSSINTDCTMWMRQLQSLASVT